MIQDDVVDELIPNIFYKIYFANFLKKYNVVPGQNLRHFSNPAFADFDSGERNEDDWIDNKYMVIRREHRVGHFF